MISSEYLKIFDFLVIFEYMNDPKAENSEYSDSNATENTVS